MTYLIKTKTRGFTTTITVDGEAKMHHAYERHLKWYSGKADARTTVLRLDQTPAHTQSKSERSDRN